LDFASKYVFEFKYQNIWIQKFVILLLNRKEVCQKEIFKILDFSSKYVFEFKYLNIWVSKNAQYRKDAKMNL